MHLGRDLVHEATRGSTDEKDSKSMEAPGEPLSAEPSRGLSEAEIASPREEELFRKSVRDELKPPPESLLRTLATPDTLKWIATTVAIPFVVWITSSQETRRHDATLAADKATADERKEVDQLTALVPGLSSDNLAQRSIAVAVLSQLASVKSASPSVKQIFEQVSANATAGQRSADPQRVAAATTDKVVLLKNSPNAPIPPTAADAAAAAKAPVIAPSSTAPPPAATITSQTFVYTQIYREDQRPVANALTAALQQKGFPVLGVQDVGRDASPGELTFAQRGAVDIRFYHPEDRAAALSLAPIITSVSPQFGEPTIHDLSTRQHLARSGTLEVWYPCAPARSACSP